MVNTLKLKAAILQSGLKREQVAEKLGISEYTLHKKIHNTTEFKASEIFILSNILCIKEKDSIFFSQNSDW